MTARCIIHTMADKPKLSLFEGVAFRYVEAARATIAEAWFEEGRRLPSPEERQHSHESEEILYLIRGRMRLYLGGNREEEILEAGQVLEIPAGVPHGGDVLEDMYAIAVMSPNRRDFAQARVVDDRIVRRP
jgi:unsaturated pyranuronate lyase